MRARCFRRGATVEISAGAPEPFRWLFNCRSTTPHRDPTHPAVNPRVVGSSPLRGGYCDHPLQLQPSGTYAAKTSAIGGGQPSRFGPHSGSNPCELPDYLVNKRGCLTNRLPRILGISGMRLREQAAFRAVENLNRVARRGNLCHHKRRIGVDLMLLLRKGVKCRNHCLNSNIRQSSK